MTILSSDRCIYNDIHTDPYEFTKIALKLRSTSPIWHEIDRHDSTNDSIRKIVKHLFLTNPINSMD